MSKFDTVEFKSRKRSIYAIPFLLPDLFKYHWIVVNSSAGKDSQAMLSAVVAECDRLGIPRSRIVVVHCDLGRVEWKGTRELAKDQADFYGIRFEVVSREKGDLLDQIEDRGMFPDSKNRFCTSDQKTSQVHKLFTRLVAESQAAGIEGQIQILSCLGIRAKESDARAKKAPFEMEKKPSNGKRHVDRWLPIFTWLVADVWTEIEEGPISHLVHPAYGLGMSRLSCVFCVFANKSDIQIAAENNRELLGSYAHVENLIGHKFTNARSIEDLADEHGVSWAPVTVAEREQWNETFSNKVEAAKEKFAGTKAGTKAHARAAKRVEALEGQLSAGVERLQKAKESEMTQGTETKPETSECDTDGCSNRHPCDGRRYCESCMNGGTELRGRLGFALDEAHPIEDRTREARGVEVLAREFAELLELQERRKEMIPPVECSQCSGAGWISYRVSLTRSGGFTADPLLADQTVTRRRQCMCQVPESCINRVEHPAFGPITEVSFCLHCGRASHPKIRGCQHCEIGRSG